MLIVRDYFKAILEIPRGRFRTNAERTFLDDLILKPHFQTLTSLNTT